MKKSVVLISLLLAACTPASPESSVLPEFLVTPSGYIAPSYPTSQADLQSSSQTASGIDVRMDKAWVDGKNVNADVCFTLPDSGDWSIYAASLTYAGTEQKEYGTTLISFKESSNGEPGLRCDTLTFIVPPDADLSSATIVIDTIAATPRAGEYCSLYMPKIQQAVLERGIGIVLDCVDVDGVLTMKITNFPPEMTREEAEKIVYSEEFFTVKGPWSFPFNLAQ